MRCGLVDFLFFYLCYRQHHVMWRWFIGLSAVPAVAVCFVYRVLPESPRYLSVVGRHEDAAKVGVKRALMCFHDIVLLLLC